MLCSRVLALLLMVGGWSSLSAQPDDASCDRSPGPRLGHAVAHLVPLSAGVTMPVVLGHTLRAGVTPVGTTFISKSTQPIPTGPDTFLPSGVELKGTVTQSEMGDGTPAHPARLSIRFYQLNLHGQSEPVSLNAVAIANFTEVDDTAYPTNSIADRGNSSPANWTTRQVGGDEVYREGWTGPVCSNVMRKVGVADYSGVYALPSIAIAGQRLSYLRALGLFSASASGTYSMADSTLASHMGIVTVTSVGRPLKLPGGDHLLLVVTADGAGPRDRTTP